MLADKTRYLAWVGWIKERGAPGCHGNSPRAALDPDRFLVIATGYESVEVTLFGCRLRVAWRIC